MSSLGSDSPQSRRHDPADLMQDSYLDSDEALTAEFRHQIGLLPEEEEGLTEAFKAHIGLVGPEAIQEVSEIEITFDVAKEATLKTIRFDKFALKNFQDGQTGNFSSKPLRKPLLPKKHDVDQAASLSVWLAIQRFMGDIPMPVVQEERDRVPTMTKIYRTIDSYASRKDVRLKNNNNDIEGGQGEGEFKSIKSRDRRTSWRKLFGKDKKTRKGSATSSNFQRTASVTSKASTTSNTSTNSGECEFQYEGPGVIDSIPANDLDMAHYVIGHGILRKDLRDEIYCQLCKQVTANPHKESRLRGWILLSLCVGCFLPSERFMDHLHAFLRNASGEIKDYGMYTRRIIKRTEMNGTRYHPPNWLEIQATKQRKYVMLPVALPDGRMLSIEADSAITSGEMITKLCSQIDLKDKYGFSLFICIYDKVSSLGQGMDHVMDAISECEQVVRARGKPEEHAPWRLFFRKEVFLPWHDPEEDSVATELIYRQFCKGVRTEEYKMRSEDDVARFVARRWYIENGRDLVPGKLQAALGDMLPRGALTGGKSRDGWVQAVISAFEEQGFTLADQDVPPEQVKWHIITTIPKKWPLQFSGLFEAFKIGGPRLPRNDVVLAISGRGIYILDEPYRVVTAFHFYELVEVFSSRTTKSSAQSCNIITIKGEEYTFVSPNADIITKMILKFLDGLRMRSRVAVGLQEFILEDMGSLFELRQGDIIELQDETAQKPNWLVGRVLRSGLKGEFPVDSCYILPAIEKPPKEFLKMFCDMSSKDMSTLPRKRGAVVLAKGTVGRSGPHGLDSAA